MKDLLLLLLAFRKKKGFKNSCAGDASTSTLNQQNTETNPTLTLTLEEMIMQLDLEASGPRRMSCVDSSEILQSARNALNQYPRFSLDGKDAMYRSSFRNAIPKRPSKVAGERVIWCKPGVVGKLMGLEAMPVPVRLKHRVINTRKQNLRRSSERTSSRKEQPFMSHHQRIQANCNTSKQGMG